MNRSRGFTLVELLLAITLMGVLLALAYGGLRAASRAAESGQELLAQSGKLRITHQFVRKQLNLMLPLAYEADADDPKERYAFEGVSGAVMFVGPMPGYLARGGPQVQIFELMEGDNGLQLQFRHAPFQDFRREFMEEVEPVVLLEGIADAQFQFLEQDPEDELLTQWVQEWEDPSLLPMAVRLDVALMDDSRVQWPPLNATVRLDPSAVIPGAGGNEDYAKRIQEMIKRQRDGGDE